MTDLDFIKRFSKITVKSVCERNNVNSSNLWSGKVDSKKVHQVRKAIEAEVGNIYVDEYTKV